MVVVPGTLGGGGLDFSPTQRRRGDEPAS